jgi:hypothetical protein
MKHYLITPWNIDRLDLEWLTARQVLFEKFCLPSVLSQTNKAFEWILVADSRTPDSFKKVLDAYPATVLYHDFEGVLTVARSRQRKAIALETVVAAPVKNYLSNIATDFIITSRLDNDDAISTNHIDKIQTCSKAMKRSPDDRFWLNLQRGYKYCRGNVYPIGALHNPFISFIEPQGALLTAYQCSHQLAPQSKFRVVQVREGHPTWMQVIHGGNVSNRLMRYKGEMPVSNVSNIFKIRKEAS